jgi:hypothetical protein
MAFSYPVSALSGKRIPLSGISAIALTEFKKQLANSRRVAILHPSTEN